jgi:hypothetical protein
VHPKFADVVESLHDSFERLVEMAPCSSQTMPARMPERGIYLFSEGSAHQYVGRTNGIRRRVRNHTRPSATHNQATFAFRIARSTTGLLTASYKPEGSRQGLQSDAVFGPAFVEAKARVALMDLRFVEEKDPTRQALLEIYVATVLGTPFNDFENH